MTETWTEDMIVTELVGDIEVPCDYAGDKCCQNDPARWIMFKACPVCDSRRAVLACSACKDARMASEAGVYCNPGCGEVVAPARHMYVRVEVL